VEDDLNGAMQRKTGIFSRIYFASFAGWKTIWMVRCRVKLVYFRAFICFFAPFICFFAHLFCSFCRVEDDLNGVMPRTSVELAKLPGVGRYTAAAVGRWN
jgi:hypothetical protein